MRIEGSLAALAIGLGFAQAPAFAQGPEGEPIAVRDRSEDGYQPLGMNLGGFWLFPSLALAANYNDNIFAASANEQSDLAIEAVPTIAIRSHWGTHALNFSLAAPSYSYSDFSNQNYNDLLFNVDGRVDIRRNLTFTASAEFANLNEPLTGNVLNIDFAGPIQYERRRFNVGLAKTFSRLTISSNATLNKFDYEDALLVNNTVFDEDDRDLDETFATLRADYAISPDTALFVSVTGNRRDHRVNPPYAPINRDSEGAEFLVGAKFELNRLARGEIGVGYLTQQFDQPGVEDTSGLAGRASLQWFPDELVTLTFGLSRQIIDARDADATGVVSDSADAHIDYELRRNIILGIGASYARDEYTAIDRDDERWSAMASIDYQLNRAVALFTQYGHYGLTSDGLQSGREYDFNVTSIGIRLQR